jgi:hypothetical protein
LAGERVEHAARERAEVDVGASRHARCGDRRAGDAAFHDEWNPRRDLCGILAVLDVAKQRRGGELLRA